jgi:hypothetical protein
MHKFAAARGSAVSKQALAAAKIAFANVQLLQLQQQQQQSSSPFSGSQ